MTTTPDGERPGAAPAPDADATAPEVTTPPEQPTAPGVTGAVTGPDTGPTTAPGAGVAPGRTEPRTAGTHRTSRPVPVPPAPEEEPPSALPATRATVSPDGSGAPTAPLPTTPAGGAAVRPPTADAAPTPPAEPVRRTSIRGAEARAAAVLTPGALVAGTTAAPEPVQDPSGTSGTSGPSGPDGPGTAGAAGAAGTTGAAAATGTAGTGTAGAGTATDLPGTGPSDASVPYGDATATPAEHPGRPGDGARTRSRRGAADADADRQPDAFAVRRPGGGVGRHLLGVLVGLLLGAVGVWAALLGQGRVLGVQAPGWDASYDPLGVVLVTAGVLVLAVVVGLGLWTPAVPVTAGAVAAVVGVVYLYVPATTHVDTVRWFATDGTRVSVTQTTVTATSGSVFLVGVLLLAAGLTVAVARRRWLPRA